MAMKSGKIDISSLSSPIYAIAAVGSLLKKQETRAKFGLPDFSASKAFLCASVIFVWLIPVVSLFRRVRVEETHVVEVGLGRSGNLF